eukprot:7981700-Alexandrium_andersonii.AAC.1
MHFLRGGVFAHRAPVAGVRCAVLMHSIWGGVHTSRPRRQKWSRCAPALPPKGCVRAPRPPV